MDKAVTGICATKFKQGKDSALESFYEYPNAGEDDCYDKGFIYGKILRDLEIITKQSSYPCNLKFNAGYNDARKNKHEGDTDYCYQLGQYIGRYEKEMEILK